MSDGPVTAGVGGAPVTGQESDEWQTGDVIRLNDWAQVWMRLPDGRWVNELGSYVDPDWITQRERDSVIHLLVRNGEAVDRSGLTDRLAEIRRRLDAASPGPWSWRDPGGKYKSALFDGGGGVCLLAGNADAYPSVHDAEFIAHARVDVEWLLSECRRLREEDSEDLQRAEHERDYLQRENAQLRGNGEPQ